MSLFDKIFGSKTDDNNTNKVEAKFYTLDSLNEFTVIDQVSQTKPVVLFKHSTRCSISRFALKRFDNDYNFTEDKMDWYLLDLLNYREISNEISKRYNVLHQSPQIIVIKEGKAVFSATHDAINVEDLKQFII